jgi:hypothetical protein
MNVEERLTAILEIVQEDVNDRGLRTDPADNLITRTNGDFQGACRSIAQTAQPVVFIVTGFFIAHAQPPCGETDGPLGAVFLARALLPLGAKVALVTDSFCAPALKAGLAACGLESTCPVLTLPPPTHPWDTWVAIDWQRQLRGEGQFPPLTHLIALERVGPSHTPESLKAQGAGDAAVNRFSEEVPREAWDRCHSMRGRDITAHMAPAHLLFEAAAREPRPITTIGIGDGGNEIGMGKVPWDVIRRNIPRGELVACRVPTDHLIVAGISNWGAYALAAGVALLRGQRLAAELFDVERERDLLRVMVEKGPLVDPLAGRPAVSVDGLSFDEYARPLRAFQQLVGD